MEKQLLKSIVRQTGRTIQELKAEIQFEKDFHVIIKDCSTFTDGMKIVDIIQNYGNKPHIQYL